MNILIDMPIHPPSLLRLQAMPDTSVQLTTSRTDGAPLPLQAVHDAEIFFAADPPRDVAKGPALKLLQIGSVGYEQIINVGLAEREIRACNGRGVHETAIGEWTLAMLINLARDVPGMVRCQDRKEWVRTVQQQQEIRGKVLGCWGYGGIGRETARLAKAIGMTVHAFARQGIRPRNDTYLVPGAGDPAGTLPDRVFTAGQELDFLSGLDFLVLAMPLTPQSKGRIGERELRALPSNAYVLNPARGALIEEQAFLRALREKWIAGAALDTHYYYPMPADHPLWTFPNVIMTPHISGSDDSPYFLERIWDVFLQNVDRYRAGRPLLNELTKAELCGA